MRRRRRKQRNTALTSLIDVLFIMLFAALMQARGAATKPEPATMATDAGSVDAGIVDAGPVDAGRFDAAVDARSTDAGGIDAAVDARPADAAPDDAKARDASADDIYGPDSHLARARQVAATMASSVKHRDVFVVEVTGAGDVLAMARWVSGQEIERDRRSERLLRPLGSGESELGLAYRGHSEPSARICNLVRARFAVAEDSVALAFVILDGPLDDMPLALSRGLAEDAERCFADTGVVVIVVDPGDSHDPIR